jgi:hypothetical protein
MHVALLNVIALEDGATQKLAHRCATSRPSVACLRATSPACCGSTCSRSTTVRR